MKVNEKSTATFKVVPLDENGQRFIPSSARYRVDDLRSGTAIIAWTNVSERTPLGFCFIFCHVTPVSSADTTGLN